MLKHGHKLAHALILVWPFSRKAVQQIPHGLESKLDAVPQQPDVLQGCDTLLHQLQNFVIQTFDARLYPRHAAESKTTELLPGEVRLDLISEPVFGSLPPENVEDRLDMFHVHDVVHGLEARDRPSTV